MGDGIIDIDIGCDGAQRAQPEDPGPPYYLRRYDPADPTRKGNHHVQVMVDTDTTCGTCKRSISVGIACTAIYLVKVRKGTLLGHRCLGECTEGRRIVELPPGSLTC